MCQTIIYFTCGHAYPERIDSEQCNLTSSHSSPPDHTKNTLEPCGLSIVPTSVCFNEHLPKGAPPGYTYPTLKEMTKIMTQERRKHAFDDSYEITKFEYQHPRTKIFRTMESRGEFGHVPKSLVFRHRKNGDKDKHPKADEDQHNFIHLNLLPSIEIKMREQWDREREIDQKRSERTIAEQTSRPNKLKRKINDYKEEIRKAKRLMTEESHAINELAAQEDLLNDVAEGDKDAMNALREYGDPRNAEETEFFLRQWEEGAIEANPGSSTVVPPRTVADSSFSTTALLGGGFEHDPRGLRNYNLDKVLQDLQDRAPYIICDAWEAARDRRIAGAPADEARNRPNFQLNEVLQEILDRSNVLISALQAPPLQAGAAQSTAPPPAYDGIKAPDPKNSTPAIDNKSGPPDPKDGH